MGRNEAGREEAARKEVRLFLKRYYRVRQEGQILQRRLSELGAATEPGGAGAEIRRLLRRQESELKQIQLETVQVLDMLPPGTTERVIMGLRHIDCKSWVEIQRTVHLTRSPCFEYYGRGIDALAADPAAMKIIRAARARNVSRATTRARGGRGRFRSGEPESQDTKGH